MQAKTKARDRGQELWFLIPEQDRTAGRVLEELQREGLKASKASVCRWAKEWRNVVHQATGLIELSPKPTKDSSDDLSDVPPEFRQIIPDRLLHVARGRGVDRVENAICILSDGLANRAQEIVEDANPKTLRIAVGALATMASAMERIVQSRAIASVAHRSYCEGDRLLAEADRLRAEARKSNAEAERLANEIRARNAEEIPGPTCDAAAGEEQAWAILRGMVSDDRHIPNRKRS